MSRSGRVRAAGAAAAAVAKGALLPLVRRGFLYQACRAAPFGVRVADLSSSASSPIPSAAATATLPGVMTYRPPAEALVRAAPVPQSNDKTPRSLAAFYCDAAIDAAASKPSIRLAATTMLYSGKRPDQEHVLLSAQYLQKELPVRLAHRVKAFRDLPFIVGCNPTILQTHEMYIKSFHKLNDFPPVQTMEEQLRYTDLLRSLLHEHRDVLTLLADGFKESRKHVADSSIVSNFLDKTLTSRLAIRILAEHHVAMQEERPNHVGLILINFQVKKVLEKVTEITQRMCEEKYGRSPPVKVNGHIGASFPYISTPLEYMLLELLKNAMRATVESHSSDAELPPINVTIANNDIDFVIRISDRGGGVSHDQMQSIWEYHYTTATQNTGEERGLFSALVGSSNPASGAMFGYGFGLPACRAYANYLGGSLTMETMQGIGSDVYLRLRHVDGKGEAFRI